VAKCEAVLGRVQSCTIDDVEFVVFNKCIGPLKR